MEGRIVAGVCAGLSETLIIDVTLVRLAFLILVFAWGLGVVLYGVLWLLSPDPDRGRRSGDDWRAKFRHRASGMRSELRDSARSFRAGWQRVGEDPWPRPIGRRWLAVSFIAIGFLVFFTSLGLFSWITPVRGVSLALILVGMAALVSLRG